MTVREAVVPRTETAAGMELWSAIKIYLSWIVSINLIILDEVGPTDHPRRQEAPMGINPYVNFNGNCREAVAFYAEVFGADSPEMMFYSDMPPDPDFPVTEDMKKLVMHTELKFAGGSVMFSDIAPGSPFAAGDSISIMVSSKDAEVLRRYWERLKEGGTVAMELGPQFWSSLYGFVTDKFGVGWHLDLEE
jgi:PhnB protein